MPTIDVAEQAGVDLHGEPRPTEDHVVVLDNAVVLLDGATSADTDLPSGGWYAGHLAGALEHRLRAHPHGDLAETLASSIVDISTENGLRQGNCPSSTVAMLRWNTTTVDALVLGDSPIVVFGAESVDVLADNRIAVLRAHGRIRTREDVAAARNAPGGFWVAEADPSAAAQAIRASWTRTDVHAVCVLTDGAAAGVTDYGLFDWTQMLELAQHQGADRVLESIRAAERDDRNRMRWPRPKRHDDQALALVRFRAPAP